ncbi:MAG: NHL repeat-containing protein [Planctomycetota bacterium]|jgi:hypothetical protein
MRRFLLLVLLLAAACGGVEGAAAMQLDCDGADAGNPACQTTPSGDGSGGGTRADEPAAGAVVFAVDLATGDREVVSANDIGDGPPYSLPFGLDFDTAGDRLLVLDESQPEPKILAVNQVTGDRSILTGMGTGTGPELGSPITVVADSPNGRAYVLDRDTEKLLRVDLATGDRRVVSDAATGDGPRLSPLASLAVDAAAGLAYVGRGGSAGIISVDLATGDRSVVSDSATGTGPDLSNVIALAHDASRDRLLAVLRDRDFILAVDLATGDRTVVTTGLVDPHHISIDAAADRALITTGDALHLMDLATGDRRLLSDENTGAGQEFKEAWGGVFDPFGNQVFVVDTGSGGP